MQPMTRIPGEQSRKRLFRRARILDRTPSPKPLCEVVFFLGWSAPRRPLFRVKRDTRAPQVGTVGWGFGKAWLVVVGTG